MINRLFVGLLSSGFARFCGFRFPYGHLCWQMYWWIAGIRRRGLGVERHIILDCVVVRVVRADSLTRRFNNLKAYMIRHSKPLVKQYVNNDRMNC